MRPSSGRSGTSTRTADHAEDLEAVRQALGFDKVGLYGVSYGTKLALAYALAHPDHVERILLGSVLPTELPDPYEANVLRAMPGALTGFCSDGGCAGATRDFAGDVTAVANKLGAKPLTGKVTTAGGRTKTVTVGGVDLLSIIVGADLSPGLAAELPAVMKAARAATPSRSSALADLQNAALLRAVDRAERRAERGHRLPRRPVPVGGRHARSRAARPSSRPRSPHCLPARSARSDAGQSGSATADFCLAWPSAAAGSATLGAGPLPNVPMLAISGGFDMRTPTVDAQAVVARFPQGKLLVVPGVGHAPVDSDFSGCAAAAVRAWMTNQAVPATCPRPRRSSSRCRPCRPQARRIPHTAQRLQQRFAIASKTIREAEAAWLMTVALSGSTDRVPGIYGGYLVAASGQSFKLVRYSITRGIALSGTLKIVKIGRAAEVPGHAHRLGHRRCHRRPGAAERRAQRRPRRQALPLADERAGRAPARSPLLPR